MLINREVFSLPPFISTSWGHIKALYMQEDQLVVCLSEGIIIKIPSIPANLLEKIFQSHAEYITEQAKANSLKRRRREPDLFTAMDAPLRIGSISMENMVSNAYQHNPEQSDMPDIPPEILEKIVNVTKLLMPEGDLQIPKAEPHCNCLFCQMSRAIHQEMEQAEVIPPQQEETKMLPVADTLPTQWVIESIGEHCYEVYQQEAPSTKFKVFLGEGQVGCNCGQQGCDHILAVLRSP